MAALGILLFLLFIAPVQVGLLTQWAENSLSFHVGVMVWGIRKVFHFPVKRDEEGKLFLETPLSLQRYKRRKGAKKDYLSLVLRLLHMRKGKHAFIKLRLLKVQAFVALPHAAETAIFCGILSSLFGILFPHGESRFIPAWQGKNRGRAVCIVQGRLGTIGIKYMQWKAHEKKEEQSWTIPSPP